MRRHIKDASSFPLSLYETVQLEQLCEAVRRLDARAAIPATSGNFSIRTKCDSFLISKSGLHKRNLEPTHFVRLSIENEANGFNHRPFFPNPSDEMLLHKLIYKQQKETNAVLHCHAPELEIIRLQDLQKCKDGFFKIQGHEILKALGKSSHTEDFLLPVFQNDQNMHSLALKVEKMFSSNSDLCAFVLENHGIYCFGNSVMQAEKRLEALLHLIKNFS